MPARGSDAIVKTAACACGKLSVSCSGEPLNVSLCHCLECQKRTGSVFGVAAFFARDRVRTDGVGKTYSRSSDSGHAVTFHFCPECGSTVFWDTERRPDVLAVAVGSFSDPSFPPPTRVVYTEHRHPWVA